MEDQRSPLNWGHYYQEEGIEELNYSLLYTTLKLETTILSAHEEIARKEDELIHLKDLLAMTIRERNEAQDKCQRLMFEKFTLQQQLQQQQQMEAAGPLSGTANSEDEPREGDSNTGFSSSDCESGKDPILQTPLQEETEKLEPKKPLPEKGKFLQAVMEAGPLLQTLLLAGQLPQWQHPPPQLNSIDIPPVTIPSPMPRLLHDKKRALVLHCEVSDSSPNTKFQKVAQQSPLTNH
ncbi:hypothetical protein F0562_025936 [Nyssa sinensis]|uniref:Uncharacterized protein n=1 Tax=Nyssa sinensis TaxID=561372 RepID=A0A5J5B9D8_9ASTE|nr:hypothetical protein F0562_025936 [Nyssa sinensis]